MQYKIVNIEIDHWKSDFGISASDEVDDIDFYYPAKVDAPCSMGSLSEKPLFDKVCLLNDKSRFGTP